MKTLLELVALNRFGGANCPDDLHILLTDGIELLKDLNVEVSGDPSWKPWADKSYLTESDLANPDIAANVRAIDDTFRHIDFFARTDDETFIGYWRGPQREPIRSSPLVSYDSEGQFALCGSRFVEALFSVIFDDEALARFRASCSELGIVLSFDSLDDIISPALKPDPMEYHLARYYAYKNEVELRPFFSACATARSGVGHFAGALAVFIGARAVGRGDPGLAM